MSNRNELKTFSLLVANRPGVLFRVTSHIKRRNFNIESIAVGPTEDRNISRMVITMMADERTTNLFVRLLRRTIDVLSVTKIDKDDAIIRELALIKIMTNDPNVRTSVLALANSSGANVLRVAKNHVIAEISGTTEVVDNFIILVSVFGVKGVSRTGVTAIEKDIDGKVSKDGKNIL